MKKRLLVISSVNHRWMKLFRWWMLCFCEAWIHHKTFQLKDYGEKSVRRKFRAAKIHTAKNPYGEKSVRRKVLRRKFRRQKFLRRIFQPRRGTTRQLFHSIQTSRGIGVGKRHSLCPSIVLEEILMRKAWLEKEKAVESPNKFLQENLWSGW